MSKLVLLAVLTPALALSQAFSASQTSLTFTFPQGGAGPAGQTLAISSTPSPATFTVATTTATGGNWLQVTPLSGATPSNLTVQLNPFSLSLSAGIYSGTIAINQTLKIPVTLNITTSFTASPTSLTFTAPQGTTPAPAQSVALSSGTPISYFAIPSPVVTWLTIGRQNGTTPQTLTFTADPTGLAPGTYSTTVAISSPSATTLNIPITFTVTPPLAISYSPQSLTFQSTSAVPQPPVQTVSVFSNLPSTLFTSANVTSGGNWLTLTQSATQTPATLTVSAAPGSLTPGTYNAQITISTARGNPALATIPVTFTVAAPLPPTLQVSPDTISLASPQGGLPIQSGLAVSNVGGGTLAFSAQITSQSGPTWLTLQQNAGTIAAGSPGTVNFTASPAALAPGTYTATITITSGTQAASTNLILSVAPQTPSLVLSQTGVNIAPGTSGQNVAVVNIGSGSLNWTATATTLSGGANWLSVLPTSGTSQAFPANPPSISIAANLQSLSPGTYYGTVNVNSQAIAVQATVPPPTQSLSPTLSANGLLFEGVSGGANPVPQTVTIYNPLPATVTTSTDDGANWLSATTSALSVSVQTTLTGLTPGVRHGTVRLGFSDGSIQPISVESVTAPPGTASQFIPNALHPDALHPDALHPDALHPDSLHPDAAGCPSILIPQITTLAPNFSVSVAQSVPISVTVVDDCGHNLANATSSSVIASFYDASKPAGPGAKVQPDLRLTPVGNGVWSGTLTPQSAVAQLEIILVALGINGTTPIAGQSTLFGAAKAASATAPALTAGIFNAASFVPGNTVASGSFVSIFGASLADGSLAPATQPLPTTAQGAKVLLGGVALPLQYVGPNQINALIPANIPVDTQQPLIVQRDSTEAAPTNVTVADSQPGIYTANQQGTGQGAVLTSDYSLDAPLGAYPGAHPATRGDFIQVFCTGLGAVTNPPAAGAAAPNSPLSYTVAPVTAQIGGVAAPVTFSGLAPGFIGLYQVNVTVPTSSPTGGAIPLTLTVGSSVSNTVTIAIQ